MIIVIAVQDVKYIAVAVLVNAGALRDLLLQGLVYYKQATLSFVITCETLIN